MFDEKGDSIISANMLRVVIASTIFVSSLVAGLNDLPNVLLIVADDLGYADLGVYGSPTINTPNLDRLANEGAKFTQFIVGGPICTPSRSSMLTGRLPIRNGIYCNQDYPIDDLFRVFYPSSVYCLPDSEITIGDALETTHSSAMLGKWHLGHNEEYNCLPGNGNQGFDFFYGLPYSHEEGYPGPFPEGLVFPPVPLMCNGYFVEQPFNMSDYTSRLTTLTEKLIWRYAEGQKSLAASHVKDDHHINDSPISGLEIAYQELDKGKQNFSRPFFIHLAYENPHVPLFLSNSYSGKSRRGMYGDSVEEMDQSIGTILTALEQTGLAENTLIIFMSDNGAWVNPSNGLSTRPVKGMTPFDGGSNGAFRDGKGSTWEGGMRVPFIIWGPDVAPGVTIRSPVAAMDIFPTILDYMGQPLPSDRVLDGASLRPLLTGANTADPHECLYYWREHTLFAIRCGQYKAHFITRSGFNTSDPGVSHDPPLLFNIEWDIAESLPLDPDEYADTIDYLVSQANKHTSSIEHVPSLYIPQDFRHMPCCPRGSTVTATTRVWEQCVCSRVTYQDV